MKPSHAKLADLPTVSEWIDTPSKQNIWLVPGLIPEAAMTLISGPAKLAHKTYFALACALGISKNLPGVGYYPKKHGKVLFIEEEGSEQDLKNRVLSTCRGLDTSYKNTPMLWAFKRRVKLDNKDDRQAIYRYLDEANKTDEPVLAVFCDTLARVFGGDENNAQDVNEAIETITGIQDRGSAVVLLAHLVKSWRREKDIDNQIRGSGAIPGGYDCHVALRPEQVEADDDNIEQVVSTTAKKSIPFVVRARVGGEERGNLLVSFSKNEEGEDIFKAHVTFNQGKVEGTTKKTKTVRRKRKSRTKE